MTAKNGSVAVEGDNTGSITNINAENVTVLQNKVNRELPSYLSKLVVQLSADMSEYDSGDSRSLPPEVHVKLEYNDFPSSNYLIADYIRYASLLEATYRGVEQRNDDVRRLVRRRAAVAYSYRLSELCKANQQKNTQAHDLARRHAVQLVSEVIKSLVEEIQSNGSAAGVMEETAHLAISIVVADAVIECDVLERPTDAITS